MEMTGLVLAAGFGTRLGSLTQAVPKPLVEIAGRPMIQHVIERLVAAGCDRIVVNAHHFADSLEEHFSLTRYAAKIILLREPEILGTGGAILNAKFYLSRQKHFLVHNADIASDCDLAGLLRTQQSGRTFATLLVQPRRTRRALLIENGGVLLGKEAWFETEAVPPASSRVGFCGVHAISSEIFHLDLEPQFMDVFDIYRCAMQAARTIQTQICTGYWTDLGTEERIRAHEGWLAAHP